jgi:hypothetical protein
LLWWKCTICNNVAFSKPQLQAEMERMTQHTKRPVRSRAEIAASGSDETVDTIPVKLSCHCRAQSGTIAPASRLLGVSPKAPRGPLHPGQSRAGVARKSEMQLKQLPCIHEKEIHLAIRACPA